MHIEVNALQSLSSETAQMLSGWLQALCSSDIFRLATWHCSDSSCRHAMSTHYEIGVDACCTLSTSRDSSIAERVAPDALQLCNL